MSTVTEKKIKVILKKKKDYDQLYYHGLETKPQYLRGMPVCTNY